MTPFQPQPHESVEMMNPQTPFLEKTKTDGKTRLLSPFLYRGQSALRHLCIFKQMRLFVSRYRITAVSPPFPAIAFACRVFAGRVAVALR